MRKYFAAVIFLLAAGFFFMMNSTEVHAANDDTRTINVVYDDSGSMVRTNNGDGTYTYLTRWCQAKYAMEVFAAMMGEDDTMNIYPMSLEGEVDETLKGSDSGRVSVVHKMNGKNGVYGDTPFATVKAAAEDLKKAKTSEKWLIVLTDGTFDESKYKEASAIREQLLSYTKSGIRVMYLTIGNKADVTTINGEEAAGLYSDHADNAEDILSKLTGMANQIFVNQELNEKFIVKNNGSLELNIDIPTNKILVFAQGENVSINEMVSDGKTIKAAQKYSVKYSDVLPKKSKDASQNYPQESIKVDKSLCGVIAVYEAGDTPFVSGKYTVSVSNTSNVKVYIGAGVVAETKLIRDGQEIGDNEQLYKGTYDIQFLFVDPTTGEPIESELLKDVTFRIEVDNNGEKKIYTDENSSITVDEGDLDISTIAILPDNGTLSNTKTYRILPDPIEISLSLEKPDGTYDLSSLGEERAEAMVLKAVNQKTGEPLTKEEWDAAKLSISTKSNLSFTYAKGEEVSTWTIWPDYKESIEKTAQGKIEFSISVDYQIGEQYGNGRLSDSINIDGFQAYDLKIEISNPSPYAEGIDFFVDEIGEEGSGYLLVTIKEVNGKTKVERELTIEEWQAGTWILDTKRAAENDTFWLIRLLCFQSLDWKVEMGDQVSTYRLIPEGKPLKFAILTGLLDLEMEYTYDTGVLSGQGSTVAQINIKPYPLAYYIVIMVGIILLIIFLLFEIIGYILKPKFPRGTVAAVTGYKIEFDGTRGADIKPKTVSGKIKYRWGPLWNPAKPQQMSVSFKHPQFLPAGATFTLYAESGDMALITAADVAKMSVISNLGLKVGGRQWNTLFKRKEDVHLSAEASKALECDFPPNKGKGRLRMMLTTKQKMKERAKKAALSKRKNGKKRR